MNLAEIRAQLRPPCRTLDIHVHPLSCFGPYDVGSAKDDARLLTEAAKRSGITKMCLFSLHRTVPSEPTPEQCREANDYVLTMRDVAPDWFLPFCYVTPAFPTEAVKEIDRCVAGHHMCGIKLWIARRASEKGLDPILVRSIELGVPVLQHAWIKTTGNLVGESYPKDVAALARRHPRALIIMAHLNGCGLRGIEDVADCPNVYIDTSGGDPEWGMVEAAVTRLGAERVVFGSDAPIRHFGVQLSKILGAELSAASKVGILWNNSVRILPEWTGLKPLGEEYGS